MTIFRAVPGSPGGRSGQFDPAQVPDDGSAAALRVDAAAPDRLDVPRGSKIKAAKKPVRRFLTI